MNQDSSAEDGVDYSPLFKMVEKELPSHFFNDLEGVEIAHRDEFDERKISAIYKDNWLYISDKQEGFKDILDDLIHELAHHVETTQKDFIYGDKEIYNEFLKKRKMLEFELKSEGYWTSEYDFSDVSYEKEFDKFLYDRVGQNMLNLATSGIFVRPYASVSLREYFATGFEAYYLGKKQLLYKLCPKLYKKIDNLHNL